MHVSFDPDLRALRRPFASDSGSSSLSSRAQLRDTRLTMRNLLDLMTDGVRRGDVDASRASMVLALQMVADHGSVSLSTYLANQVRALYFESVLFASPHLLDCVHRGTSALMNIGTLGMSDTQLELLLELSERMSLCVRSRLPTMVTNVLGIATQASSRLTNRLRAQHPHLTGWFQSTELVEARLAACVTRVWSRDDLQQLLNYMTGSSDELIIGGERVCSFSTSDKPWQDRYLDWYPVLQGVWERGTLRTQRTMLELLSSPPELIQWLRGGLDTQPLFLYPLLRKVMCDDEWSVLESPLRIPLSEEDDLFRASCVRMRADLGDVFMSDALTRRLALAQLYYGCRSFEALSMGNGRSVTLFVPLEHDNATDLERELAQLYTDFVAFRREATSLSRSVPTRTGSVPTRVRL